MFAHTIAFVAGEAILRILCIQLAHQTISGDFGNDACRGDAQAQPVAADQCGVLDRQTAYGKPVDQGMIRCSGEIRHGSGHGEVRGVQNVQPVDFLHGGLGHGPLDLRSRGQGAVKLFTFGRGELFRIGQAVESGVARQNDRSRHNRTCQRAASGFVHAGNKRKTAGAQGALAAEIAGHRPVDGQAAAADTLLFSLTVVADLPLRLRR